MLMRLAMWFMETFTTGLSSRCGWREDRLPREHSLINRTPMKRNSNGIMLFNYEGRHAR